MIDRAALKVFKLISWLSSSDVATDLTSFATFVGYMDPEMVDGLQRCGRVDPVEFLDKTANSLLSSPKRLFPVGMSSLGCHGCFKVGSRHCYLRLIVRI